MKRYLKSILLSAVIMSSALFIFADPAFAETNVYECESLPDAIFTGDQEGLQQDTYLGVTFLRYQPNVNPITPLAAGHYISFTANLAKNGTFNLKLNYLAYPGLGIYQISVDGTDVGLPIDMSGYGAPQEAELGTITLPTGSHTFKLTLVDTHSGGYDAVLDCITLTKILPAVPVIVTPANGSATSDNTPTFSGTAEPGRYIFYIIDDLDASSSIADGSGNWSYTGWNDFPEGSHTFRTRAADEYGNTSPYSDIVTFTIDTTPPAAPVVDAPVNGSTTGDNTPTFTGTAEAGCTVAINIDGAAAGSAVADGSGNWSFTQSSALSDGPHAVKSQAIDTTGNASPYSNTNTFTVDTPPVAPVMDAPANGSTTGDNTPTFTGTAEAGCTVAIIIDGTAAGSTTADGSGNWSFTQASALADGPHAVKSQAIDTVGNTSPYSNTNTFTVDTKPPSVEIITPSGANVLIATNSVSISFNEALDVNITGTVTINNSASISALQWSSNHKTVTFNLSGLTYSTSYTIDISGFKDEAGNLMTPDNSHSFLTTADGLASYNPSNDNDESGGDAMQVLINNNTGNVTIIVNSQLSDSFSEGSSINVAVPAAPGVDSYTLRIPAANLRVADGKGTLTFSTDTGSAIFPANFLEGIAGADGKNAEITIGLDEKSSLPDAVKEVIGDRPLIQLTLKVDDKQIEWNNPSAPVIISIPYAPTTAELKNPESIVIWYIDGNNYALAIPNGHYDSATGTVTFSTTHFSCYAVGYNKVNFSDVAPGAWYSKAVGFIAARGITIGTGNGNYSPKGKLTRAEFIVMLMKAYGINPDAKLTDNFADSGNTYYTGYLAAAKRLGISSGVGNNMFAPVKEITRQEMFALLYNALKVIEQLPQGDFSKTLSDFTDSGELSSWAKDAMILLVKTGIAGGSNGKLTPTSTTTRAEMAQVLYNLLSK